MYSTLLQSVSCFLIHQVMSPLHFCRHFFLFQMPYLAEFVIRSNDYGVIDLVFRGRRMGVKNQDNMSEADVEAYKYFISMPGQ